MTEQQLKLIAKIYRTTPDNVDDGCTLPEHIQHCEFMVKYDDEYSSNLANPADKRTMVRERFTQRTAWLNELKETT